MLDTISTVLAAMTLILGLVCVLLVIYLNSDKRWAWLEWMGDENTRRQILVDNPTVLYGFDETSGAGRS